MQLVDEIIQMATESSVKISKAIEFESETAAGR